MKAKKTVYGIVYRDILGLDKLTLKGIAIYAMLTTYANGKGKCWPSISTLTKDLPIDRSTIIRGIKELIDAEIISKETGKNNCNIYTLSSGTEPPLKGQVVAQNDQSSGTEPPLSSGTVPPKHSHNNIPINTFDDFWNLYDKKVGAKKKCEKKWNNLTDSERQKAIDTIPAFKERIQDKKYQPYPETYLNEERWEDNLKNPPKTTSRPK